MANLTYCDEIDPTFGVPWPEGMLRYNRGKLACALTPDEVDALSDEQVVILASLVEEEAPEFSSDFVRRRSSRRVAAAVLLLLLHQCKLLADRLCGPHRARHLSR